ncbi:MAG: N-glycosylase/DNA lyase [Candidatus Thermoplasmatota archaeon]|nr:N-glycosylase/DNA lyase [Candidatus Thermoplasmatota archaeon]
MAVEDLQADLQCIMQGEVKETVEQRMSEFSRVEDPFSELCFCVMTANAGAQKSMEVQKALSPEFRQADQETLRLLLKQCGYRFINRAAYICHNRRYQDIGDILRRFQDQREAREWLVRHVKGLGYKEASHFLRNVGYTGVAIIDRHVLRLMKRYGLIEKIPDSLSGKRYLELERILEGVAADLDITLAELDLYLWYMETGKILK